MNTRIKFQSYVQFMCNFYVQFTCNLRAIYVQFYQILLGIPTHKELDFKDDCTEFVRSVSYTPYYSLIL